MQPKTRILDLYGTFVRDLGGWISISALVEFMAALDVEAQAVRSATSRMKRRGLLASDKRDGAAGYRLTEEALQILRDGDSRIFRNPDDAGDPAWVVALFSVPEAERSKRYVIRSRLMRLGFAQGPAGSWFAPASVLAETRRMLERQGLTDYVTFWLGDYVGSEDLRSVVAQCWDLPAIAIRYEDFIARAESVAGRRHDEGDLIRAFADYMDLVAMWRPLPYLDPGLPDHVTPPDWPAARARRLFTDLDRELRPLALRHFVAVALPAE